VVKDGKNFHAIQPNTANDVLIGQGLYTEVFLGVLNGKICAVKKLYSVKEIQVQVSIISRMCNHGNVAQLFGYFLDGKIRVLAYEYAPRGSLYDILHGKE